MVTVRTLTPKQEDRRERILSAARDMVADHGYEGMVMSHVAEKAGVSPTTLYNLYNTKDELVLEALRELLLQNVLKISAESAGPGWKFILKMILNGAWMANSAPAYAEAITQAMLRANSGDALIEMLLGNSRRDILLSLRAMREAGELDPRVNTDALATSLVGVYWSTFMLWNKGLVKLQAMEHTLQLNFLAILIPPSLGAARAELEALYNALLDLEKDQEQLEK